jgi:hypothetical protein
MPTASRLAARAGVALLLLSVSAHAAEPHTLEYLSIEANEGGSSGGHAAIRFDDVVYHFQHHAPGVLRLHRDDASGFLFTYSLLQNRDIAVSRISVADDTYAMLRSWFNRRYLTEGIEFDALDAASGDRALIALLLRRKRAPDATVAAESADGIGLRGAGYFFADGGEYPAQAQSAALAALRERVQALYGSTFLQERSTAARAALTRLVPADGVSFSRRYADLMTGLLAIAALQRALPLRPGSFEAPALDEFRLSSSERAVLDAFASQLEDQLVGLLHSPRPDWGFPLLVGMARLVALRVSVRTGRLAFLDSFAADARSVPPAAWRGRPAMMLDLLDDARTELERARRRLTHGALREADYTSLESASNRFNELRRGVTEQRAVRVQSGPLVPARPARRTDLIIPVRNAADLQRDLRAAQQREQAVARELQQRYAYNLIARNCVSEIFRGINSALAEAAAGGQSRSDDARLRIARLHAASLARLGGYIEPGAALTFIPFVSTRAVRSTYRVTETRQLPSYRARRLAAMYRHENPLLVFLRESNTLTSTVYGPNPRDSFFLFFGDVPALRPLLGSANLVAGAGAGALGLALLPLDGGRVFLSAVRGMLFSLPELAFVELRKGTFDYVERAYRPVPMTALPAG